MDTATFVRRLEGFTGDARLYKCDPPMSYRKHWDDESDSHAEFVIVSGTSVIGNPETYIFPSNEDGDVTDWGELNGSFQGDIDHERALNGAGYMIAEAAA